MKWVYFDMDGTVADLYGVAGWLDYLLPEDTTPYVVAEPMHDMVLMCEVCEMLQDYGYHFGVITWTAKGGNANYNKAVEDAKLAWLRDNMPFIEECKCVEYGTPKHSLGHGVLFDDVASIREEWDAEAGRAYTPEDLMKTLYKLFLLA